MQYKYDIVIAHYGIAHLTEFCRKCLQSIRQYTKDYRIVFIDNASPEFDLIEDELNTHPHLLIRNTTNLGFIKAANQGIALSNAPYIVLLNNDTEVAEDWIEKLKLPLENGAALSGPLSTAKGSWQGMTHAGDSWEFLPDRYMLAFFCTMFKREVFDKVGLLDEDFGVGFGDDDWFCHKANLAGYKLALVRNLVIKHNHRTTFKELYGDKIQKMQMDAMKLLQSKQANASVIEAV